LPGNPARLAGQPFAPGEPPEAAWDWAPTGAGPAWNEHRASHPWGL